MTSAAKHTTQKKSSARSPLGAPPQPINLPDDRRERISNKAFELWEERGYRDGHDLDDWLDAETLIMEEIHEARK